MAVFLTYPAREDQKRGDGIVAVVVDAADAGSVPAAARALFTHANTGDFEGWATLQIAATPHADFRAFCVQGHSVTGKSPLPSLGRGGNSFIAP